MGSEVQKESLSVPLYEEVNLMSVEAQRTVACFHSSVAIFPCKNRGSKYKCVGTGTT